MTAFAPRSATLVIYVLTVLAMTDVIARARVAHANGPQGHVVVEPPTRFERFVVGACSPCVKESHTIAALTVLPLKLPTFPRMAAAQTTRSVEISVEVLRAYPLGQPSRRLLALRMTALVATGAPGQVYRLAEGLLDEEEVGALVVAIGEISRTMQASPSDTAGETVDVDFHGGSLRVGAIRLRGDTLAYVQGGDMATLGLRAVWEVPTTVYLPVTDLPALANAVGQAAAKIQTLRGAQ
jgi:hypothetical protein